MADLASKSRENDVILLMPNDLYLPSRLYVSDSTLAARIKSVPAEYPAANYSDFYPDGFPAVPGIRAEDAPVIEKMTAGKDRVFLVTRQHDLFDPNDVTRKTLRGEFTPAQEEVWGDIRVERFDRN
jgi:hypothetical protein